MDDHRRAAMDLLQLFDAAKIPRQGLRRAAELSEWLEAIAAGHLVVVETNGAEAATESSPGDLPPTEAAKATKATKAAKRRIASHLRSNV